jgi:hypothetical protein
MRRAPRARVQIDSRTTPTTGPPALPPRDALEEDGAARAHPLPIRMDMAPAGDAVADAGAANALDEAMHDHAAAADSEDELQTTMPNGLQLTKSNTVNAALQLAFRVPLSSAHRARTRDGHACGMEGSLRCALSGGGDLVRHSREVASRHGSTHGRTAKVGSDHSVDTQSARTWQTRTWPC